MPSSRFMTDICTVWIYQGSAGGGSPFVENPDGGWIRKAIKCTHAQGSETKTDQNGAEFQPKSTFYVAEEITRGVKIKLGNIDEVEPPADAETVRKVETWTPLRNQSQDWVLFTG